MIPRIKICGITSAADALAAVEAGADGLGFMFYEGSPRHVSREQAADIIRELPPLVASVGVFVNPTEAEVRDTVAACDVSTLQFHGEEPAAFCRQWRRKFIKAFRVQNADSLKPAAEFPDAAWLLDSFVPGQRGGTGAVFNWDVAAAAARRHRWVVLAGGLTPDNVAEAVRHVRPFGLDVSSGVESAPGRKDAARIRAFIEAARSVGARAGS